MRALALLLMIRHGGGDLARTVLLTSTTAALDRAMHCAPPPPSSGVVYMCGLSNVSAPWPCPAGASCATTWPDAGPFTMGPASFGELQVRTAGYPVGMPPGATSCTLFLLPQGPGASVQLRFKGFRLNSQNFFSVQEYFGAGAFDPAQAPYLLAAASGSALPPAVQSGPGNGLVLSYYAPEVDRHDPQVCDGVVALARTVPSGPALGACALAATCGACASVPGCAWCDTSGTNGLCAYTGVGVAPPLGGAAGAPTFFNLPPPPATAWVAYGTGALCNASQAFSEWTACPEASDRLATAALAARRATDAVLSGLITSYAASATDLSYAFGAAVGLPLANWSQALSAPSQATYAAGTALAFKLVNLYMGNPYAVSTQALLKAELADVVTARLAFLAVLVLFLVLAALLFIVVLVKRAAYLRTGNQVKYILELAVILLCLCKALEYMSYTLLLSLGLDDLLSLSPSNIQLLFSLGTYSADAQYVLLVLVAFMTTPTIPNSKHSLCALGCVLLPSVLVAVITAALAHYSRNSLVLPAPLSNPLGPALSMEVCYVALPATSSTGAPATLSQPVHMSLLQVFSALLFFVSAVSTQTFSLLSIASEDLITTSPLHFRPPLVKALGSILMLLSLPVEVAGQWAVRCLGMAASAQNTLATAHLAPSAVMLFGVAVAFLGIAWQLRIDAMGRPVDVNDGLKLNVPRDAEGGQEAAGGLGNKASAEVRPAGPGGH